MKNQDILSDDESHFKLAKFARFVLKIASFEFANLLYFNSTFMNLKIARLVLNAKCEVVCLRSLHVSDCFVILVHLVAFIYSYE